MRYSPQTSNVGQIDVSPFPSAATITTFDHAITPSTIVPIYFRIAGWNSYDGNKAAFQGVIEVIQVDILESQYNFKTTSAFTAERQQHCQADKIRSRCLSNSYATARACPVGCFRGRKCHLDFGRCTALDFLQAQRSERRGCRSFSERIEISTDSNSGSQATRRNLRKTMGHKGAVCLRHNGVGGRSPGR